MFRTLALFAAAILAAQAVTLRGVVNDGAGARVAGATVTLLGPGRVELATATTGDDGTYAFELPPRDASAPMIQVKVEKAGLMSSGRALPRKADEPAEILQDFSLTNPPVENITVEGKRPEKVASASSLPQRIRVGSNVQASNLVRRITPEYPKELQEQGIAGVVELEAVIGKDGAVQSLHPRSKLVHEGLIDAAARAIQGWVYRPTLLNGEPVEVTTTISVRFALK